MKIAALFIIFLLKSCKVEKRKNVNMKNVNFGGQLSSTKMLSVTKFCQCVVVPRRNYKYLSKYTVNKNRNERQQVKRMLLEINKNLLAKLKQLPFLLQIWGHNKTAWQCKTWNKLQKQVTQIVGFFIILVKNIVQSWGNKQVFVDILKQTAYFFL